MIYPSIPSNEQERLQLLQEYQILYTEEEEDFDFITQLAASIAETPIALITLVAQNLVWHKAHYGTDLKEAPREHSFCAHGINHPNAPFLVENAKLDERFFDNPYVAQENGICFYYGIPITLKPNLSLGMLCVVDTEPRSLTPKQIEELNLLSKQLLVLFNLHKSKKETEKLNMSFKKTQALLEEAQKLSNLGVWELDLETGATFWTEEVYRIHEVDKNFHHDLQNGIEFYHPKDRDLVIKSIQTVVEKKIPIEFDARLITAKGNIRYVRITVSSYFEENKQKLIGCIQDISKERERHYISKLLEAFFDLSPIGIALNDFETGQFLNVNNKLVEPTGYTKEEFLSLSYWDITPKKYQKQEEEALISLQTTGKYGPYQKEYKKKDGTLYPVLLQGILVEDIYGKKKIWSVIENLSEKLEKERIIQETKEQNESIVKNVPGIVYRYKYGKEWDLVYISPYVENLCGYKPEELLHCEKICFHSLILQDDFESRTYAIEEAVKTSGDWEIEYRVKTKNGSTKWFWDKGSVLKNSETGEIFLDGILLDITEKIALVQGLQEATRVAESYAKTKAEFVANMSHEIRTPLNGILGFLELLQKTELSSTQKVYIETIQNSSLTLLNIVNDVLDFSKLEAGKLELEYIDANLYKIIEESLTFIAIEAGKKGLSLILDISPNVPINIKTDPIRLKQIFVNLLSNAVKFTSKGEVTFKISFEANTNELGVFYFEVKDTGIGITEEQKQNLFKAFSQADTSITRKFGGTGLGLIISNLIAKKMNTQIYVDSTYGKGSRFYFQLLTEYSAVRWQELSELSVIYYDSNPKRREILIKHLQAWKVNTILLDSLHLLENIQDYSNANAILISIYSYEFHLLNLLKNLTQKTSITVFIISGYFVAQGIKKNLEFPCKLINYPVNPLSLYEALRNLQNHSFLSNENQKLNHIDFSPNVIQKILIAEDNPTNLLLTKLLLKEILPNAITYEVSNGKQAISKALEVQFDLILMDIQMPEMDGLRATKEIRKQDKNKQIPIVALTAGVLKEEQEKCIRAGMNKVLIKPITLESLKQTLAELFQKEEYTSKKLANQIEIPNSLTEDSFDKQKLLEVVGNSQEMYLELLESFMGIQKKIFIMEEAVLSLNFEIVRKISHELKGVAGNLFFNKLYLLARDLEQKAKEKQENLQIVFAELKSEWEKVENFINKELNSNKEKQKVNE